MHNLGQTRSASHRDHLLQTPDTFIRTPLPGLTNGEAIVHISPACGAAFSLMTIELAPNGTLTEGPTQRLLYVLEGELSLSEPTSPDLHELVPGSYAYLPSGHAHNVAAHTKSRIALIEKPFLPLDPTHAESVDPSFPQFLTAHEDDLAAVPLNNDPGLLVRSLLPTSLAFDFAVNTMTYAPGAALSQVEIHHMEHGLLMLEGGGIYRLNNLWYPTLAGDAIWMAPFCPQWFGCIGKTPAKYLIYKDFNRHPLA
jgi:(S)-ureidoglycine aminohydrolase